MSDLCFCHLNGYKVKDSTARAGIEELNANKVSNEGLTNAINGVNNSIAGVQAGVDDLNTRMNASVSGVQAGVDDLNTRMNTSINNIQSSIESLENRINETNTPKEAKDILYNNKNSGLNSSDIQGAIDELAQNSVGGENPNCFGSKVDIKSYTLTNTYTIPCDGYITMRVTGNSANNDVNVYILGANNTSQTPDIIMSVGNTASDNKAQSDTLFVRKGMKCGCAVSGASATVSFIPLV